MIRYEDFDAWFDAGRPVDAVYGPCPTYDEIESVAPIAILHPIMTYPWGAFIAAVQALGSGVWVLKTNPGWIILSRRDPSGVISTDRWFGVVTADGWELVGAS